MSLRRKFQGGGADAGASSRSGDMGAGAGVSRGAQRGLRDRYNRRGTKYSDKLSDAIARANARARERSLEARKQRAALEAIQAAEAKQVTPTQSGVQSMVSGMDQERENLRNLARKNRITNQQLNRLGDLNTAVGFNRTRGMGPVESLRNLFSRPEFKQGIAGLARNYSKISPMGMMMRRVFAPQYDQPTGIEALPDFQGMQRTNQMFGPGVYDFTQPTRMPMTMAEATPEQRGIFKKLLDRFISPSIMENQIDPMLEQQEEKRDRLEELRQEMGIA